ncbi:MAG: DUF5050 domain-containing protein [Rhodothermales bacterium]|nr:DUF5050 domain-containing protein [Rhodothermales bacterium]
MNYLSKSSVSSYLLCARQVALFVVTAVLVAPWETAVGQPKIYWLNNEDQHISQANLDGSSQEILTEYRFLSPGGITVEGSTGDVYWADADVIGRTEDGDKVAYDIEVGGLARDVALDHVAGKAYWTKPFLRVIERANLDGSEVEEVVDGVDGPTGIAVDAVAQKVYWTDSDGDNGVILRANFDGTDSEVLVTAASEELGHMELDVDGGKMYWVNTTAGEISRSNLDGSSIEQVVSLSGRGGISLDLTADKIYWVDWAVGSVEGSVRRANLDGSGIEDLPLQVFGPTDIAVDPARSRLYVLEDERRERSSIQGSTIDGVDQSTFVVGMWSVRSLTLDFGDGKLYWLSSNPYIQRSNLDGTGIENLHGPISASQLVVDEVNDRVYWIDRFDGIFRINDDGTGAEQVVGDTFFSGENLVVDGANGKMYWIGESQGSIHSASLDGSDTAEIVTSTDIETISIDASGGKIYWYSDTPANPRISRANLDGTGTEDVVTGQLAGGGLVLHPAGGKIYWADLAISRADLDGSNVEELLAPSGADDRRALAIDVLDAKMYWFQDERIERANLDGSEHEIIVMDTGRAPQGLLLGRGVGTSVEGPLPQAPALFEVEVAFPNPFRSETTFSLSVNRSQQVRINLYDALGRELRLLHQGWIPQDHAQRISFEASGLPSGLYFYRIRGEDFSTAGSVVHAK